MNLYELNATHILLYMAFPISCKLQTSISPINLFAKKLSVYILSTNKCRETQRTGTLSCVHKSFLLLICLIVPHLSMQQPLIMTHYYTTCQHEACLSFGAYKNEAVLLKRSFKTGLLLKQCIAYKKLISVIFSLGALFQVIKNKSWSKLHFCITLKPVCDKIPTNTSRMAALVS